MNAFDWMVFCTFKIRPLEEDRPPFWARGIRLLKALLLLVIVIVIVFVRWLWCALKAFLKYILVRNFTTVFGSKLDESILRKARVYGQEYTHTKHLYAHFAS